MRAASGAPGRATAPPLHRELARQVRQRARDRARRFNEWAEGAPGYEVVGATYVAFLTPATLLLALPWYIFDQAFLCGGFGAGAVFGAVLVTVARWRRGPG